MTEQQTYTDATSFELMLTTLGTREELLLSIIPAPTSIAKLPVDVMIPATTLLAMIDRAAPDALRSYLRERSDLIDGPGEPLTVNGANMTAEQAVYGDVPEGDPLDALGMVTEARMLIETADQHLRGLDGALDASQMISNASDRLRNAVTALVPEADSPEDVDELPTDETERRLHIIERLAKILRAGTDSVEVCTLADWVIDR